MTTAANLPTSLCECFGPAQSTLTCRRSGATSPILARDVRGKNWFIWTTPPRPKARKL